MRKHTLYENSKKCIKFSWSLENRDEAYIISFGVKDLWNLEGIWVDDDGNMHFLSALIDIEG